MIGHKSYSLKKDLQPFITGTANCGPYWKLVLLPNVLSTRNKFISIIIINCLSLQVLFGVYFCSLKLARKFLFLTYETNKTLFKDHTTQTSMLREWLV